MIEGKIIKKVNLNFDFGDTKKAKQMKEQYENDGYLVDSEHWPTGTGNDQHGYFYLEMRGEFKAEKVAAR